MKKIFWTLLLTSPLWTTGIIVFFSEVLNWTVDGDKLVIFRPFVIVNSWTNIFENISNDDLLQITINILLALFLTTPLWYGWKGTWFFNKIRKFKIGLLLRISIIISFFIWWPILMFFSLIGLWLKS